MPLDFPLTDVVTDQAAYDWFVSILWPDGPVCPHCGPGTRLTVHNRAHPLLLDYLCKNCMRTFNVFQGTIFHASKRRLSHLYAIVRGFSQGVSTNQLSRELGCKYPELLDLRHKFQDSVWACNEPAPLPGPVHETDEMYQNAGEKRKPPRRSRRPAAPARQQKTRPRNF